MTEIPKINRYIHAAMAVFSTVIEPLTLGVLGTALSDLICITGTDLKSASSLFFSFGFGRFVVSVTGIFMKNRLDTILTMVSALVVAAFSQSVMSRFTFLPITNCIFLIFGCCCGIFSIGQLRLVNILWPRSNLGCYFITVGLAIAGVTGPPFASLFVNDKPQTQFPSAVNITSSAKEKNGCATNIDFACVFLSMFSLFVAAGFLINHFSITNKGLTLQQAVFKEKQVRYAERTFMYKCFAALTVCMFGTITACVSTALMLMVTYVNRSGLHLDIRTASAMTTMYSISLLLARIFCIFIADRVKPHVLSWICLSALQVTSVIFIIYRDSSVTMLWVITVLRGLAGGPLYSSILSWTKDHMTLSSQFICVIMACSTLGNLAHSTISGALMGIYGPDMFIYITAGTRILQLVLFGAIIILKQKLGQKEDTLL